MIHFRLYSIDRAIAKHWGEKSPILDLCLGNERKTIRKERTRLNIFLS